MGRQTYVDFPPAFDWRNAASRVNQNKASRCEAHSALGTDPARERRVAYLMHHRLVCGPLIS
jgi:hypothetical protein